MTTPMTKERRNELRNMERNASLGYLAETLDEIDRLRDLQWELVAELKINSEMAARKGANATAARIDALLSKAEGGK